MEAGTNVLSILSEKSKFTENTKANGKYGGWTSLGKKFYNQIYDVIVKQRGTNKRKMFEEEVKQMMQNKKRERKEMERIVVSNDIDEFLQMSEGNV